MSIALKAESHITSEMLQARIDELNELSDSRMGSGVRGELDESERNELEQLCAFQSECEKECADWNHGDAMINESAFLEHITQLIDDCYELPKSTDWPYRHLAMDYQAAADEAKADYTTVELDGTTFYCR